MFDRIWYNRSVNHDFQLRQAGDDSGLLQHQKVAAAARRRIEERIRGAENLGPHDDFEWGMLRKLSALRWVLVSEWDFLDT